MNRLIQQLTRHEGFRGRPYTDTTGHLTIGYGRNLTDRPLTRDDLVKIVELEVTAVSKRLQERKMSLEFTEEAKTLMADKGYDFATDEDIERYLAFLRNLGQLGVPVAHVEAGLEAVHQGRAEPVQVAHLQQVAPGAAEAPVGQRQQPPVLEPAVALGHRPKCVTSGAIDRGVHVVLLLGLLAYCAHFSLRSNDYTQ